jgi:FixJ family two-component response regulator
MIILPNSLVFAIDDDSSVRKGLSRLLRSAGYEHEIFESASDFLARPRHSGPACVIVDVQMPVLNGMDFQGNTDPTASRGTTRFCYRSWRHSDVRAGDESWRGRFSSEAVS